MPVDASNDDLKRILIRALLHGERCHPHKMAPGQHGRKDEINMIFFGTRFMLIRTCRLCPYYLSVLMK